MTAANDPEVCDRVRIGIDADLAAARALIRVIVNATGEDRLPVLGAIRRRTEEYLASLETLAVRAAALRAEKRAAS